MFHRLVTIVTIIATIIAVNSIVGVHGNHLIGDYVCTRDEKYIVTFEKHIKKNVTRREFVWCMSVPPRCSKYVTQEVDSVKIVEEERTRKVDKCCDGYTEDKTETYCVPECKSCINGICTSPETCTCIVGFSGPSCNNTCDFRVENCALPCTCANGEPCHPETGNCICGPGTTGFKCEISLSTTESTTISTTLSTCIDDNCKTNKTVHEAVKNETKSPDVITEKITTEETSTEKITTEKISIEEITTEERLEEVPSTTTRKEKTASDYNIASDASKKNFNSIGKTHQFSDKKPELLQMDQIMITNNDTNVKDTLIVFIVSIAIGVAVILILVAIMSIMISRYKKQRDLAIKNVINIKSSIDSNRNRLSTEPIIQRSVFHAPLPDPPIFHNPVFTLQDCQNMHKVQYSNFSELNSPDTNSQYDFPPSSGSYRAVSLPDPGMETTSEPVYDEIPASRRPRPVSAMADCRQSCCNNAQCQWNNT